jgi:hypothetical protein
MDRINIPPVLKHIFLKVISILSSHSLLDIAMAAARPTPQVS